jgi:hypothetical protein
VSKSKNEKISDEEYQRQLQERADAWDNHLNKQKMKNISKESAIGKYYF